MDVTCKVMAEAFFRLSLGAVLFASELGRLADTFAEFPATVRELDAAVRAAGSPAEPQTAAGGSPGDVETGRMALRAIPDGPA